VDVSATAAKSKTRQTKLLGRPVMKTKSYEQTPRVSATGVITVAILATVVAMALSLFVDPTLHKTIDSTVSLHVASK
jgi:hypothetical protein